MRRSSDLDSNCLVVARPYCNGRATAFNKVLSRSCSVVCESQQKTGRGGKASIVGFHCPDSGTVKSSKFQAPSSRETSSSKLQKGAQQRVLMFGSWSFSGAWSLVLEASTSVTEVALRNPAPRDSQASTNRHAPPRFAGSARDRFPSRRV